jgi:hypothetical protein
VTKAEALKSMGEGNKVTHRYFSSHEWMTLRGNFTIVFENDHSVSVQQFYADRNLPGWEDGYSLFN